MLATSQRIALRFTFTIAVIVLFLGVVINLLFFGFRWQKEQMHGKMSMGSPGMQRGGSEERVPRKFARRHAESFGPRNVIVLSATSEEVEDLIDHTLFKNLAHFEDERYLYRPTSGGGDIIIVDISTMVANQIMLLWITFGAVLLCSIVGYALALYTVRRGLRDLHILAEKVQTIDVDSLQTALSFDHLPEHDEIQIVSRALQSMTKKLHDQVETIRQFVANVSHEFKTPLMSLQSTIDVSEKTKQYDQLFVYVREQVGVMHRLLDTLTLLTRLQQTTTLEQHEVVVWPVVNHLIQSVHLIYPDVHFIADSQEEVVLHTNQGLLERVVANLLDNAGKFTPAGGTVTITLSSAYIQIADTGSGISAEHLSKIWDPFWQGDQARTGSGFGLGLSLVKTIVDLLQWSVSIQSVPDEGTTVTVAWGYLL